MLTFEKIKAKHFKLAMYDIDSRIQSSSIFGNNFH
jgi:hypothetical protein